LVKAKTIGLIIGTGIIWGILMPGVACMKNSNRLSAAMLPPSPADSAQPAAGTSDRSDHTFLALGDSYTIGQSVDVADRYPVQAVQLLESDHLSCQSPEIIATTGWTTEDLIQSLISDPPALTTTSPPHFYSVVTLLIGVNNQYQGRSQSEYRDQFTSLLQRSIALAGNQASHVIVLSIPDYSVTPFAQGHNTLLIAAQIDSFNTINNKVSQDYKVHYIDITIDSRRAASDLSLIASDGLHFSGKEYAIWAERMRPVMKEILK
jgi:lysophospholipase L1-like esterase